MQIGKLRKLATIQRAVMVRDAAGESIPTWQDLATNPTEWVDVRPLPSGSGEIYINAAEQRHGVQMQAVGMRYRADIDIKMRLLVEGRVLEIETIADPSGRRAELRLTCREVPQAVA